MPSLGSGNSQGQKGRCGNGQSNGSGWQPGTPAALEHKAMSSRRQLPALGLTDVEEAKGVLLHVPVHIKHQG